MGTRATKGASPIRILARRYADGLVERRVYIVERRRLLDAIAAGEIELPSDPVPTDVALAPAIPAACALGEEDDTVELRMRQTASRPAGSDAPAAAEVATPAEIARDAAPLTTPERAAEPTPPTPADTSGWWMVVALLTGLLGVATWLWWQLSPL